VRLRRAESADAAAIARIHGESRRVAMPTIPTPDDADILGFVEAKLLPPGGVTVAVVDDGEVLGYACARDGWLEHLYVAPEHQGTGVGTALLADARARTEGPLHLWVFQVNDRARRFYEHHGARAARFTGGADNMERAPDVLYVLDG
jgi:GNAT superfamily N-acetyltransferase